jgi:hypothetical protein
VLRRFKFEKDIYETLDCVPMAVRRKLDRAGIKISMSQWQALGRGERLAICHLPANLEEERDALSMFITEAVASTGQGAPKVLSEAERQIADPPHEPPEKLIQLAKDAGFELTPDTWHKLDEDERYVLTKLAAGQKVSADFPDALKEMLEARA